jgi:hypothetical protein
MDKLALETARANFKSSKDDTAWAGLGDRLPFKLFRKMYLTDEILVLSRCGCNKNRGFAKVRALNVGTFQAHRFINAAVVQIGADAIGWVAIACFNPSWHERCGESDERQFAVPADAKWASRLTLPPHYGVFSRSLLAYHHHP